MDATAQVPRAWATLQDRADAIADGITLTILESQRSWYDAAGPEQRAELRQSTREHIRRGIRTMAGLADRDEQAVHVWRETGRLRAKQRVPLEHVLSAYSLGTRMLWEALLEQRTNPEVDIDDAVLLEAGQQIWASLDVQCATVMDTYRRESARLQRQDLQRQQRLLDALLAGRGGESDVAAEIRDFLGIASDEPVACVVAHFDGLPESPLRAPEDRLERYGAASYWHTRGDVHFGLVSLAHLTTAELVRHLERISNGRVGVAVTDDGPAGFPTAYRMAANAADTLPRGTPQVATIEQRLPEVLLGTQPDVVSLLVRETLGPILSLPEHQRTVLLDTLGALIAHQGSPTRAAEALFCHRNTVIYRMHQVEQLTGRSLANPRDRLMLDLAQLSLDPDSP